MRHESSVSDSGNDLGGYGSVDSDIEILATRRPTRSRRSARSNLADNLLEGGESDGDTYHDSPRHKSREKARKKLKHKRAPTARPAYGHFRDIDDLDFDPYDDEATLSLRAHRDICEKCHKRPAHELLMRVKKGKRKTKEDAEDEDEDNEDHIRGLGGWVRWFGYSGICSFILLTWFTASSALWSPIGGVWQEPKEMR